MNTTRKNEKPIQPKALAWTIGVHALLLLFLLLYKYSSPVQAAIPQDLGIEVNLGTDLDGSGTDQPMDMEDPAAEAFEASTASNESTSESMLAKELLEDENTDAPPIKKIVSPTKSSSIKPTPTKPATTPNNNASTTNTKPRTAKYTLPASNGKGGNSAAANQAGSNEGDGTSPGDKGVAGGTPGAKNYTGNPGTGNFGIGHSLGDRRIIAFPEREAAFNNGGTVVLRITVNREGRIVAKQIKKSASSALSAIAMKKAEQVRFDKNEDAPAEQFGTITFVFKTRG